jgi:hypothetical protein
MLAPPIALSFRNKKHPLPPYVFVGANKSLRCNDLRAYRKQECASREDAMSCEGGVFEEVGLRMYDTKSRGMLPQDYRFVKSTFERRGEVKETMT